MKQIPLTKGLYALVDDDDFDQLSKVKWYASCNSKSPSCYVIRNLPRNGERQSRIKMHRLILNAPKGIHVDHINGNTLDNRRSNLRLATQAQNAQNRRMQCNNTSGFKGVSWNKHLRKWKGTIWAEKKCIHLGWFDTPETAYSAYCEAAEELHGEFRRVA